MSRFGKEAEDHLRYKLAKVEKANEELIKQANEMAAAINFLKQKDDSNQRVVYLMLYELGGSFTVEHEEFASVEGKIMANIDEEKKTTTFFIMGPDEEEQKAGD